MASTSSSSDSAGRVPPEAAGGNPSKKRVKDSDSWRCNVAKKKRNSGEEYVSVATSKTVSSQCKG